MRDNINITTGYAKFNYVFIFIYVYDDSVKLA